MKGTEVNDGSFITVEVAALYLISAIYHKTAEFAEAPYLSDGKPVSWQSFNTPERVREARESTEKWIEAFTSEGIEALRSNAYLRYRALRFVSELDVEFQKYLRC